MDGFEEILHVLARAAAAQRAHGFQRAQVFLRAVDEQAGEGVERAVQRAVAAVVRQQRQVEGGFLEFVHDVVGAFDQAAEEIAAAGLAGRAAGAIDQFVGLVLPVLGPLGVAREAGGGRLAAGIQQAVAHAGSDLDGEGGLLGGEVDQALLRAVEIVRQLGAHLVLDEALRPSGEQALGAGAEDELHVFRGRLPPEHAVQAHARRQRRPRGEGQRLEHHLLAAGAQEGHVAVVVVRRPFQQGEGLLLRQQLAQALARAVPVDEEHQPGTEEGEVVLQFLRLARRVGADAEVIDAVLHRMVGARAGVLPAEPPALEQALQEEQALHVHVGVGELGAQALDMHDEDVGVGGADVVLQHQGVARARRRRAQAGMVELQRQGLVHAAHEGADEGAVLAADVVGLGAVDHFGGHPGLEGVEHLVHVHHQQVQAVGLFAVARGHGGDLLAGDEVVRLAPGLGGEQLQACGEAAPFRAARGLDRLQHALQILVERRADGLHAGYAVEIAFAPAAGADDAVAGLVGDAGGLAFDTQVGGGRIRVQGPRLRHLQQAEVVLGAVVGGQGAVEQGRQQQAALAERVDDVGFFHGDIRRIRGIVSSPDDEMMSTGESAPACHMPVINSS